MGSSEDTSSGGRQMPAHWGNKALNIVSQSSCTGSQCLPAVGCAEASRYIVRRDLPGCVAHADELTYVSLGEGATSEGEFWESLNTACQLRLPILYLVADNGWAISVPASEQAPAPISELVQGFRGLAIHRVDGTDYFACRSLAAAATARVRTGDGPCLIHATVTRPYSHSSQDTQSKYRSRDDLAEEAARDPILRLERELTEAGVLTPSEAAGIREEVRALIAALGREVLQARRPDPATVTDHVLALPKLPDPTRLPAAAARSDDPKLVGMGEAIRLVLFEQMRADERIRVFGQDVADAGDEILDLVEGKGGVFGTTHGLQREFGTARCYNAPLSRGQHHRPWHRPGVAGTPALRRDPVLRLHLAGHATDPVRGGDNEMALRRAVHCPVGDPGRDRRLPDWRRHLALTVRRVDLHPYPGSRHRHAVACE